jgi:hypothetical protein
MHFSSIAAMAVGFVRSWQASQSTDEAILSAAMPSDRNSGLVPSRNRTTAE